MHRLIYAACGSLILFGLTACGNNESHTATDKKDSVINNRSESAKVKEEGSSYTADGAVMKGYVAYDEGKTGARPVILVVPEWWGLTDYARMRAKMLAELGYFAVAVDMFGDGKQAENPKDAEAAATPFYTNPALAKGRMDEALLQAAKYSQADTSKLAAIGYCFGGSMVLNWAKSGAPTDGVVSFHGGLKGVPPQKGTKSAFLICNGEADSFVPAAEIAAFRKGMDSAGIAFDFINYPNATHAFTNPAATEKGKQFNMPISYNGAADTASWNDMKAFLNRVLK